MKTTVIIYWASTLLICFLMGFSAFNDLTNNAGFVAAMRHLGYPDYLMNFLGIAKVGAVIVLLLPKQMLLKHWAYAGISIDLIGAAYSHYKSGDGLADFGLPLIAFAITLVSYFLYLKLKVQKLI
jgi:DoxX-like family